MRNAIPLICLTLVACVATHATAQTIAFTFDDGPHLSATPRLSPQARNQAVLDALAKHDVKATLFVTAGKEHNNRGQTQCCSLSEIRCNLSQSILRREDQPWQAKQRPYRVASGLPTI